MKKIWLLFAAVLLLAAGAAQAQSCSPDGLCACDFVNNGFESLSGWTYNSNVTFPYIADPCLYGAPQNRVAQLAPGGSVSRTFTTDEGGGHEVEFLLYLPVDDDNYDDLITVRVQNLTTNQTEQRYFRGSQYDTSCTRHVIQLNNDYSSAQVKVTFFRGAFGTGTMQIDNVSFYETYC